MPKFYEMQALLNKFTAPYLFEQSMKSLSDHVNLPVICYMSAFTTPGKTYDSQGLSIIPNDMQGFQMCVGDCPREGVLLILHTPGGNLEATKQIITYLRSVFKKVNVAIPHLAYSGGTMIVCSANEIFMGPYSFLGPTDPQLPIDGQMIPVGALLDEFNTAVNDIEKSPARAQIWLRKIDKLPVGRLHDVLNLAEQAKETTKYYLEQYHLANDSDVTKKAEKLASFLHRYENHTSHGHGISIHQAREQGFHIKNLDDDKDIEDKVLSVFHAASLMFGTTNICKVIANSYGINYFLHSQL